MKFDFKFSNLCGTLYKQGNLLFTPDGNCVLSPVGNRITVLDLINHKCYTLPSENRKNIWRLVFSPNGNTLLSIDEDGHCLLINFHKRVVLAQFNFKKPVRDAKFSPDSKYVAVTHGRFLQVWRAPPLVTQFAPFSLYRTYSGHTADLLSVEWTPDSKFIITTAKDNTARVFSLRATKGFIPLTLSGHHDYVMGAFFSPHDKRLFTVSRDGALFLWHWVPYEDGDLAAPTEAESKEVSKTDDDDEEEDKLDPPALLSHGRWKIEERKYFNQRAKVNCAAIHHSKTTSLLVVGFATGVFGLYEMPDFNMIHTLSISHQRISTVAINSSGEWLAFGAARHGQLLVWEWQSETYVIKQQGHFFDVNTLAYSPDGQLIATGADDGKIKIWNAATGFCFVTFSEHSAPVTNILFSSSGTVVLSASLDGTVRAYDLVRYRNFRTMTSPDPVQFVSLAVDPSGDVICAGSLDPFQIYVWSLQTGRLLDVLPGHQGPISGLAFHPGMSMLASGSWDKTIRLWDVFDGSKDKVETLNVNSDVLAVAFRPDGKELCSASLDGQLYFWDVLNSTLKFTIEGRKDIMGGRRADDPRTAQNSTHSLCFNSICYSADGQFMIAGGESKWVCIYEISQKILIKKFQISHNRSMDGVLDMLSNRRMTEAGNLESFDVDPEEDEEKMAVIGRDHSLPGRQSGMYSKRKTNTVARTKCVRFSPTGRSWSAASTEGLLIYSLDDTLTFDPFDLEMDITPSSIRRVLSTEKNFAKAFVMSLKLNERDVIVEVMERTPPAEIPLVLRSLPTHFLATVMHLLATGVDSSPHLEFYLIWCQELLTLHGRHLKNNYNDFLSCFRAIQKGLSRQYQDLSRVCEENRYQLEYLSSLADRQDDDSETPNASESIIELLPDAFQLPENEIKTEQSDTTTNESEVADEPGEQAEIVESNQPSKKKKRRVGRGKASS